MLFKSFIALFAAAAAFKFGLWEIMGEIVFFAAAIFAIIYALAKVGDWQKSRRAARKSQLPKPWALDRWAPGSYKEPTSWR